MPSRRTTVKCCRSSPADFTVTGVPCIFPFTHPSQPGVKYHACTKVVGDTSAPWCATAVDGSGLVQSNDWGFCSEVSEFGTHQSTLDVSLFSCLILICFTGCKSHENENCLFPWRYSLTGKTYNSCTKDDDNSFWCAVIYSHGITYQYGTGASHYSYCSSRCPTDR